MSAVPPPTPSFEAALACLSGLGGPAGQSVTGHHAGLRLASHFQPIFSLSHGRVVGHEALLRASDATGAGLPPPRFFDGHDFDELLWRDQLVRTMHMANYAMAAPQSQWLFLNLHPQVFLQSPQTTFDACSEPMPADLRLQPKQIVVEVLEDAVRDDANFDAAVATIRSQGGLIALDDFGAGHSNFDRVWRLRPEIVKLDRSLVERAALDLRARRVVIQMTSLLHECGALVLMEGVETEAEAFVALEADADLVQGYFFARPQAALVGPNHASEALNAIWSGFGERWREEDAGYRERIAPYFNAIGYASALLAGGRPLEEATQSFLALPGTELCYLLGQDGRQVGVNQWGRSPAAGNGTAFEPFRDTRGARWARRPYFRRAVAAVGKVQVTRPYRTLHGSHLCVTVSTAFRAPASQGGELQVICGDLTWS